jgi:hypothetical protein
MGVMHVSKIEPQLWGAVVHKFLSIHGVHAPWKLLI